MRAGNGAGPRAQAGTSMIEVLVSILIVVLGLLGLAGLQTHANLAEAESFQRGQAINLLNDMADRINANRLNAKSYVTASPVGTDIGVADCSALTAHQRDLCEWSNALLGASETTTGGTKVGAMIGARGCVANTVTAMPRQFVISIAWQGINPTKAPVDTCGSGLYGDEKTRRVVSTTITIACLQNDPASGLCTYPPE